MKKNEKLLRAMSKIRPQYIEDAEDFAVRDRHGVSLTTWKVGVGIAVAACVGVAAFVFYPRGGEDGILIDNKPTAQTGSSAEGSVAEVDIDPAQTQLGETMPAMPGAETTTAYTGTLPPEWSGSYPMEIHTTGPAVTDIAGTKYTGTDTGTTAPKFTELGEHTTTVATLPPFSFGSGDKQLTRADIIALAKTGKALTWGDLAAYKGTRYAENVCEYLTADGCVLTVIGGATNPTASTKPQTVSLRYIDTVSTLVLGYLEDIRDEDVAAFFQEADTQYAGIGTDQIEIIAERKVDDRNYAPPLRTEATYRGSNAKTEILYGQGTRTADGKEYGYIELEYWLSSGSIESGISDIYLDTDNVLHVMIETYTPPVQTCDMSERLIELHYAPNALPTLKGLDVVFDYEWQDSESSMFTYEAHRLFEGSLKTGTVTLPRKAAENLTEPTPVPLSIPAGMNSVCWFNKWEDATPDDVSISGLPNTVFHREQGCISVTNGNTCVAAALSLPILGAYFTDLNDDGHPELCVYGSYRSGLWDEHVEVFDIYNRKHYILKDYDTYDYTLVTFEGEMHVQRTPYAAAIGQAPVDATIGKLVLKDGILSIDPVAQAIYD